MQGISPTGLGGSNLDVDGLVEKLVGVEGAPAQNRLDLKEIEVQASISAFGVFRGAVSDFQSSLNSLRTSQDFNKISSSSSDEDSVIISANNEAQAGVYSVEVNMLAQSHRLTSEAFSSELDSIGMGNLSFQFGRVNPDTGQFVTNAKADVKNIKISDENNSLLGVAQAINQANFGVRASIINDGKGHRLTLSTQASGEINSIRLVVDDKDGRIDDGAGLSRLSYDPTKANAMNLIETSRAQDAVVLLDGIRIESDSNTISGAIKGVTLELKNVTDSAVKLTAEFDIAAVKESIDQFVAGYNDITSTIKSISGFDPDSGGAGPLAGDSSVRGLAEQLRRVIGASFNGVNDDLGSLASIGIETQRDGTLTIDDSKLREAIDEELQQVTKLFSRAGSTSDSLIRYISAADQTNMGTHEVSVSRLPSKGTYIGKDIGEQVRPLMIDGNNALVLQVDGVTSAKISIEPEQYESGTKLANELQKKINNDEIFRREDVSVTVSYALGQMIISSNRLGGQSQVDVISADEGIKDIGIDPAEGIRGENIMGRIGLLNAEGMGKTLTGTGEAQGIQIEVLGGKEGRRGNVSFSVGVAEQLSKTLERYVGSQGVLQSRTEGLTRKIEDIGRQREQLARRLDNSEKRLIKQFSSLDATLGKLRSTSNFLSSRLAALPGARNQDN